MDPILQITAHRPFPLPREPWIMKQVWNDLMFAHWPIPVERMRRLVPAPLELDLFEGSAWVAVTPFHISGLRFRYLPPLLASNFLELNTRTYVTYKGIGGVFFFSLDASSRAAVLGARLGYYLPYFSARMQLEREGERLVYTSSRVSAEAEFAGGYQPVAAVELRQPGSIEHFLTERYCLYTVSHGIVRRAVIHHVPWPLQNAQAEISVNTVAAAAGIALPQTPHLLHFSKRIEVLVWHPERA